MLQAFREHKRWLMFIAMVLIIPSFVVTGIYSYNRMSQSDNAIVKVGDVSITPEQFDLAKREQLERLRQQMGEAFRANLLDTPQAREDILRMLMDESAVTQTLTKNHVVVSEADAIALIKNADALKKDGKFSAELYEQFLRSQGKSDQQFVAEVRRDLEREVLVAGVANTHPVPKALVEQLYEILTTERNVRTSVVKAADFMDTVKVSDDEVKSYYDAHPQSFLSPEHVSAQYVVLSPEDFRDAVKVNPDEVKAYYEQNQRRWGVPEERRASHILIEFGSDKEAAKQKAEAILAEVKADRSKFAEIAQKESADPGSAAQGGDLSFFGRGLMTKAFEDAVFAAQKGDIVGPVETEFGWHVIEVTDIHPASVRPFEEVRAEIEREYIDQMAIRAFSERADEFSNIVYEQADSLDPVAEKFGIKVQTVDFVTRSGVTDPELGRTITDRVAEALFGTECLKEKRNSSALEVRNNVLVAARVVEHFSEARRAMADVKDLITEELRHEKAAALAKEAGEKKLAEVKASNALDGFDEAVWVSRQHPKNQETAVINAELAIPTAKLPAYTGAVMSDGSYVISYVSEARQQPAKPADLAGLTRELRSIYGDADRTGYLEALKATIGVKVLRPKFVSGEEQATAEE